MAVHPRYAPTLGKLQRLNPSAEVLARVSRLMRDPNSRLENIVEALRSDASLTSDIIRMGNSPYYGFSTSVTTLEESLQRIGLKEAQKVVNLSLARSLYSKALSRYQISAQKFWALGLSCAMLMEALATRLNINPGEAYTLGTFHGLGKVVLDQVMTDAQITATLPAQANATDWERTHVGVDYAQAGADLLKRWGFHEDLVGGLIAHVEPAPDAPVSALALGCAVDLIEQCGSDLSKPPTSVPPCGERLGLTLADIESCVTTAAEHMLRLRESLGMKK